MPFSTSQQYWKDRYEVGRDSGFGSYGQLARFKAKIVSSILDEYKATSVIELGCGDGNQAELIPYPEYIGLDIATLAIRMCERRFGADKTKRFEVYDPGAFDPTNPSYQADMAVSMDVIFHFVEDDVYETYMNTLFKVAQ